MGCGLSQPTITADFIHGHLGRNSLSLSRSRCAVHQGGKGGISIEASQINEPSINTPPPPPSSSSTLLFSFLSFCHSLFVLPPSLRSQHGLPAVAHLAPPPRTTEEGGGCACEPAKGATSASRARSERSYDQQASTRSGTDWLAPQAQPRGKDPEGVNSTISELFHTIQQ